MIIIIRKCTLKTALRARTLKSWGAKAIDLLSEGAKNRVVAYRDGKFVDYDITEALQMEGRMLEYMYEILEDLSM